ncbi:MAG: hypothetical protein LBN29_12180 [Mediterranea sp.]|jgi:hypothetical protein|nr:hypothetical protein [Mediterranea sp.]
MKKKVIIPLTIIVCLLAVECVLRFKWGFCDALLYRSDPHYEYIAQPNQSHHRFGCNILYNSYSQRNDEPDSTRIHILGLGDSVLFGGQWIDQDSLATSIFTRETGMQMLNISAGSWGPDNCAAYLKENGTFGAKAMILVCSSHDAYDVMDFKPVVGVHSSYPSSQYKLAIVEVLDRYLLPRLKGMFRKKQLDPDEQVLHSAIVKKGKNFNPGFFKLKEIAANAHIPFLIYLHPDAEEQKINSFNEMGQLIIKWANENHVPLYNGFEGREDISMYHDGIHLNVKGQKNLSANMETMVEESLNESFSK